jgi:hypothetical protein
MEKREPLSETEKALRLDANVLQLVILAVKMVWSSS